MLRQELISWLGRLIWRNTESALRFGPATVEQQSGQFLFHVQVFLGDMNPDGVSVELYAEAQKDGKPITQTMNHGERPTELTSTFLYSASVPTSRPVADYTPRLIPRHPRAFVPLEAPFILWHETPSWR